MANVTRRGRSRRTVNEINMVPFIDVMLVLLIIFMVTAPMFTPGLVDTPTVGKSENLPAAIAQVVVDSAGQIEWRPAQGEPRGVPLDELGSLAKQWEAEQLQQGRAQQDMAVVIAGDKKTSYEHLVNTYNALKDAQVGRVALLFNKQ
ncbi:protein TolR [Vandammella animalimorsus]|uniref:Protein TolR n=1 Tax=Vandammella animalimorsus TaxID=2029117 RepID=A0A2A2AQU0_9BURK|nr:biopolymer transporter ExbD [Vandammella animalimorsus]PAT40206.1 protein TolR [Vandammella animalimorsus]